MENLKHIVWTLDVSTKSNAKLYSDITCLTIAQLDAGKFVTRFTDFNNSEIYVRFSVARLLKLKYPFVIVFERETINANFIPRGLCAQYPGGNIRLRLINGACLEIYLNEMKVGELIADNEKIFRFFYLVYLDINLTHEQICYIYMIVFSYFLFFVDESGIRSLAFWEEKHGKRESPYFIPRKIF